MTGPMPLMPSLTLAALGGALIHFLWQASLGGVLAAAVHARLRGASARARYAAHCAVLFSLPAVFLATLLGLRSGFLAPVALVAASAPWVARALPYIVWAWVAGAVAMGVYSLGGWMLLQRARLTVNRHVPDAWRRAVAELSERLRVRGPVALGISAEVKSPCVLGWLRPMILMPAAALLGMPAEHLEALLAHELAHIRRRDYLVNLLQRGVEVAFFFHPAVWWISRQVTLERENCCDDIAIEACGSRLGYARALVDLESWRGQMAVAASGGSLQLRVQRVLGRQDRDQRPIWAAASMLLVGGLSLLLVGTPVYRNREARPAAASAAPARVHRDFVLTVGANVPQVPIAAPLAETTIPVPVLSAVETGQQTVVTAVRRDAPHNQAEPQTRRVVYMMFCTRQLLVTEPLVGEATPLGVPLVGVETVMQCQQVQQPVSSWAGSM